MIRLFLIDAQTLSRQGVEALISKTKGIKLVGHACDYCKGLLLLSQVKCDVVLINHSTPGLNSLDFFRQVLTLKKPPKILVQSMFSDQVWLRQAVEAGADGYLLNGHGIKELEQAIHKVMKGNPYLPEIKSNYPKSQPLSSRECEVFSLIAEGHTSKETGSILNISYRTVDHHRSKVMDKLRINDIQGLTKYAIRCGIIDPSVR